MTSMHSSGVPAPPDPPVEVQAAKINASAVVVAALIAILAAFMGAYVTSQASAAATNRQTDQTAQTANADRQAQADREAKSFIRSQLQTVAAKLIDDSKGANRKEVDLYNLFASPTFDGTSWDHVKMQKDLTVQVDAVSADTAKLQLLAYLASNNAAAGVLSYHQRILDDLTGGALAGNCLMPGTPAFTAATNQAITDMEAYDATQGVLISAVQSDLGLPAA